MEGCRLASVLKQCGVNTNAKKIVFYGADSQPEDVTHGRGTQHIDKNYFARSLSLEPRHICRANLL